MTTPAILADRTKYSLDRLTTFKSELSDKAGAFDVGDLAVFCAGSYARLEASPYSDIDLFFVYDQPDDRKANYRTNEIKLFSALISVSEAMGFPPFSNDAQYLSTLSCSKVLEHMGSPLDDSLNLFTMRMLMLLESRCILNEDVFSSVQRAIISSYYRDYPDHKATFEPWFLINDIGRFWKTLLVNYEHKRNQPATDIVQKNKQKVKNFKLKYSRMTTCFATVAAIANLPKPTTEQQIFELIQRTPQERLQKVAEETPRLTSNVERVLTEYAWFIEQTGQTEEELRGGFEDEERRTAHFDRAEAYGDAMYDLIEKIGENITLPAGKRLLRYLVI